MKKKCNDYEMKYNRIQELTKEWSITLKERLKKWDPDLYKDIINYIRLDSFKLVQWMWKVLNNQNAVEVLSFRDWCLSRNQQYIELFDSFIKKDKKTTFYDRIEWKEKELSI